MDLDISNLRPDQVQELWTRVQAERENLDAERRNLAQSIETERQNLDAERRSLAIETQRLRAENTRAQTPLPSTVRVVDEILDPKLIPKPKEYKGQRGVKVNEFRRKVERYLRCLPEMSNQRQVDIISGYLVDHADTWFNRWIKGKAEVSSVELLNALVTHFNPGNGSQKARSKLQNLKQRTSVEEYSTKFREILEEIVDINENEAKSLFVNGLKDNIQEKILLQDLNGEMCLDEIEQTAIQIDLILFKRREF